MDSSCMVSGLAHELVVTTWFVRPEFPRQDRSNDWNDWKDGVGIQMCNKNLIALDGLHPVENRITSSPEGKGE
jgi:hypothetical protein